jgi:DNA-binding CsgD family transcriptional regulator
VDLQERVRQLAAAGGDLSAVRTGLDRALRLSLAYDLAAISTVDPATMLWTSCFISGMPPGGEDERERILYGLEFDGDDINSYTELANSGRLVGRLHQATDGDLSRARRWGLLLAQFGISDEMRVMLTSRNMVWGSLTLYRRAPRPPFTERDENIVRGALTAMADLFRLAMLRAAIATPSGLERPPGMIVVSPDGEITAVSEAARKWLDVIDDRDRIPSVVRSVAAAAAAGDGLAHAVFPVPEGRWVILHGSPLGGRDRGVGIIIEGAQPVTLSEVIAGAYGLTPREREITAFAAQGRSTKQIASALGISPFTVQDHLKAVFGKVGVQSRAELVAALYVRHYEPRRTAGSTPGPYGWYLDDYQAAAG